ncbi:glutamate 5-kinase, partial [Vibrio parahaemolyticus V-223/04]
FVWYLRYQDWSNATDSC